MSLTLKTLKAAMKRVNEDPTFKRRGTCDAVMGIKAGSKCYAVTFSAFEVTDVRETDADDLVNVDFYIEMKKREWDQLLDDISAGNHTTLNELDLAQNVVKSSDELKRLTFLQYHTTFQHYIEAAAA